MATIGALMIETGLTTVGLKRDLDQAVALTESGARRMKQILDEFGKPAWAGFDEGGQRAAVTMKDVEQGLRTTSKSVKALALPLANELAPAFGSVIAQMTQSVTMSLAVQRGFGGVTMAAVGVAGILAGQLLSAWQANVAAKREFDQAMRTGDLGALDAQVKKTAESVMTLHDEIVKLQGIQQRGGRFAEGVNKELAKIQGGVEARRAAEAQRRQRAEEVAQAARDAQAFIDAERAAFAGVPAVQAREDEARFQERERLRADAAAKAKQEAEQRARENQALLDAGTRSAVQAAQDLIETEENLNAQLRKIGEERMRDEQEMAERHRQLMATRARDTVSELEAAERARQQVLAADQAAVDQLNEGLVAYENAIISGGDTLRRIAEESHARVEQVGGAWDRASLIISSGLIDIAASAEHTGDVFVRMVDRMSTAILDVFVGEAIDTARSALRDLLRDAQLMGLVRGIAGSISGSVAGMFGASGGTVVGLQGPSAITGAGVEVGVNATMFAEGGIVRRPTLGVVGESGPEAVVPLDQYRGRGGTGTTVVIEDNRGATAPAVEVRESQRDGMQEIRVLIHDTVNGGFRSGFYDSALQSGFGVTRRGLNR